MRGEFYLSGDAQKDLDNIWDFLYSKTLSVNVADNFIDYIFSLIQLIADRPNIGVTKYHIVKDLRRFPFPHHKYYIYYTLQTNRIYIERIVSALKDQDVIFE